MSFYSADLHIHSSVSDGAITPEEVIRRSSAQGLDYIGIADHNTIDGSIAGIGSLGHGAGLRLVFAQETSAEDHLHLLILGIRESLPRIRLRELDDLSHEVHSLGGAVIIAHPWSVIDEQRISESIDRAMKLDLFDGMEILSGGLSESDLDGWVRCVESVKRSRGWSGKALIGSSDWHDIRHGAPIGFVKTYIQSGRRGLDEMMRSIRRGETVASISVDRFDEWELPKRSKKRLLAVMEKAFGWAAAHGYIGSFPIVNDLVRYKASVLDMIHRGFDKGLSGELLRAADILYSLGDYRGASALISNCSARSDDQGFCSRGGLSGRRRGSGKVRRDISAQWSI